MKVGVLALQGAFARHIAAVDALGHEGLEVRTPAQLLSVDRLILPGGESTTMNMLLDHNGLRDPIATRLAGGMPVFGTCAGMILLATEVLDGRPDQVPFKAIDITVRRNGYGRQTDSFEATTPVPSLGEPPFPTVFIRAPIVESAGPAVDVLAAVDGQPILCRQGPVLVSSFHPELSADLRLHQEFCSLQPGG